MNGCQNADVSRDGCVKMSDDVQRQDQEKQDRTQKSKVTQNLAAKILCSRILSSFCLVLSLAVVHYHCNLVPGSSRFPIWRRQETRPQPRPQGILAFQYGGGGREYWVRRQILAALK